MKWIAVLGLLGLACWMEVKDRDEPRDFLVAFAICIAVLAS